jgi:hypothetical protein
VLDICTTSKRFADKVIENDVGVALVTVTTCDVGWVLEKVSDDGLTVRLAVPLWLTDKLTGMETTGKPGAFNVTVALYTPAAKPALSGVMVTTEDWELPPGAGDTLSQFVAALL